MVRGGLSVNAARAIVAEFIGTATLLLAVVGSGIMAERLCGGNVGLALLANALATGTALVALILTFGPLSGAHFNPVVSLAVAASGGLAWERVPAYLLAQVAGALVGVAIANLTFALPVFSASTHVRSGTGLFASEIVATFGLLAVIFGVAASRPGAVAYAVAAYITGAYWFTPSTSFANPAVTIARAFTDTFAGIAPVDVPAFVVAQAVGAAIATVLFGWLLPKSGSAVRRIAQQPGMMVELADTADL
jgi:glycerol uptake facilitator-like aquaporin